VVPYSRKIARAHLKEPKYYFFDTGQVIGDRGTRLENMVALSLYKEMARLRDLEGVESSLHFIRNKEKQEIDFLVMSDRRPPVAD